MQLNNKRDSMVLTGHTGQIGSEIFKRKPNALLSNHRLEKDLNNLQNFLLQNQPNAIINAAAYTRVDEAEKDRSMAYAINVAAVETMASVSQKINSCLVHFSTDYVFDGLKREPYLETDICSPCNYYGITKRLSESLCLSQPNISGVVFRTSWVMGAHGNNFVKTILRLGMQMPTLKIIDDQVGRPTCSKLLAQAAIEAASKKYFSNGSFQIVHLTDDGEPVSWFHLAKYILNRARDWNYSGIEGNKVSPISSDEYGQAAKRPKNSVLSCGVFDSLFDTKRTHWQHTIDNIIEEIAKDEW